MRSEPRVVLIPEDSETLGGGPVRDPQGGTVEVSIAIVCHGLSIAGSDRESIRTVDDLARIC